MTQALPLAFSQAGENAADPPLIVLHGLFGSARNWNTLARRWAESRHVFALDLRNHGSSPAAPTMSYPEMAWDVRRFLDDRGYARADLLGHSMGGKVAMTLALTAPERIDRLIVADIAPVPYRHSHEAYVEAMLKVDLAAAGRRQDIDAQLAPAVPEAPLRAFLLQNLAMEDGRFRWRINLEAIGRAMADLVGFPDLGDAVCQRPALFLAGARSDYLTLAEEGEVHHRFPAARVERLAGAGHWLHAEQPEIFARKVEEFLAAGP